MIDFVNPAERGAKVFSANIDAIAEAIMFTSSSIQVNESNKSLIDNLLSCDLGYLDAEKNTLHLRNFVIEFVNFYKNRKKRNISAPDISGLIDRIKTVSTDYALSKVEDPESAEVLKVEASDLIIELSNNISENMTNFADQCFEYLSLFNNYDMKMRKAEQSLKTAKMLITALEILSPNTMDELAVGDADLQRVISKRLKPSVFEAIEEMNHSHHRLDKQLFEWKKDIKTQERINLIDALHRHFANNRTLNADIDFNKAPDSFRRVPLIKLKARADIYLEDFENTLSAVAQTANQKRVKKDGPVVEKERPPVEKATHTIVKAVSPLDKAAFFFFDAFGSPAINEISAKNAYIRLEPGCKFEYWISRLLYEFELNHSNHLELQLVGETDAKYNGNYYISDIVFRRKDSNGKVMQCA